MCTLLRSAIILLGSTPTGVPSINTRKQSLRIGIVVNKTMMENMKVMIGSIIPRFGKNINTTAATTTPID